MTEPHASERIYTRWPIAEGYCTPLSVDAGGEVSLRAASRGASFRVEVRRWGSEGVAWLAEGVAANDHSVPERAWAEGCGWPVTVEIQTDVSWKSGLYEVTLTAEEAAPGDPRATSQAFFVVRAAPTSRACGLLVLATNTYNAYNQWGGKCLYSGATHVSFERPTERGYFRRPTEPGGFDGRITNIDGDPTHRRIINYQERFDIPLWTGSAGWWNWERRFVEWAHAEGFEFDLAINADLETVPELLDDYDVLLSVGHDEYWTRGMRDAADRFVEAGGRWAIFSGNTCFWQVRIDHDTGVMTGYKGSARRHDPVVDTPDHHLMTTTWSDPRINHPETTTTGLTFSRGGYHRIGDAVRDGTGAYRIHEPDHWAFADTGLAEGELLGEGSYIVGYEVDGCAIEWIDGRPRPTGEDGAPIDMQVLATAPARLMSITDDVCEPPTALWDDVTPPGELEGMAYTLFGDMSEESVARIAQGHAVLAYLRKGEGEIFNAGSADWCYGLDHDPQVRRVTANVLRHFGL
ncbi:MAG: N,N-dimethylformamidase beta subunit family domain-containing protein [Actinomycetota bacterium]